MVVLLHDCARNEAVLSCFCLFYVDIGRRAITE